MNKKIARNSIFLIGLLCIPTYFFGVEIYWGSCEKQEETDPVADKKKNEKEKEIKFLQNIIRMKQQKKRTKISENKNNNQ